jgi:hypothetical protein
MEKEEGGGNKTKVKGEEKEKDGREEEWRGSKLRGDRREFDLKKMCICRVRG